MSIDPETGIRPIAEWGPECARGFVSNARFSRGKDRVIKRTDRSVTRRWRKVMVGKEATAKKVPSLWNDREA